MDKIKRGMKLEGNIPPGRDAWGRMVPQYLPYDFSDNESSVSAIQYCNGWNDAGGYWLGYVNHINSCCDDLLIALEGMVLIHDEPSGFEGKFGKALDYAISAQKEKIDARLVVARSAIAKAKGIEHE